jgi:hypothetical protein
MLHLEDITREIIAGAIEVHQVIGPAFLNQPTRLVSSVSWGLVACALSARLFYPSSIGLSA